MNKQTQFAWEYRLQLISKADSLESLDSLHDFCRGFLLALLSALVVTDAEFDALANRMNSVVIEARERILQAVKDSAADLLDGVDNEEPEQVSVPAASPRLSVRRLFYRSFSTQVQRLHPKIWCPLDIWAGLHALKRLPAGWPPLSGKRPLVGGEGEVRLPSF